MKVGLIGTGTMGRTHAQAWAQRSDLGVLSAVYTPSEKARQFAADWGLSACDTLAELLEQVDIVDICTPTPQHCELTLQAAQAGKHVICEKPIALTLADADQMISACAKAGVRLFIAHVLRFFPQYAAAWQQVQAGAIGTPQVLRLSRISAPPSGRSWLLNETESGGVSLDLMIHDLEFARWVAGEVVTVYATASRAGEKVAVQATLSHAGGAISLVEAAWAAPAGIFRTSLDIAGTTGVIEWSSDAPAPLQRHGPAPTATPQGAALPALAGDPYALQLWHAYDAIATGQPFLIETADARAALAIALAVQQSIQTGQAVNI